MRKLLKETYIPFGSQYYRAPSPHKEDWEKDLKNMADLGFNMVKYWVQWRWNHPEENKFYFDDIDELMELSEKYNLKVMLNTIFDVAPQWIYKKYPDASMVTLGGREIGPQTQPHRQIGGLGYCFNHDGVMEHFFRFLGETIKRYKDHPALEIWNVGSEPELTSSMAEMRAWADDAEKIDDMLCHCKTCQRKFRIWLDKKYGDIEKLNRAWNRNYTSFYEAEIPKTRNTFNDIIDWRMFFVDTIGQNVKRRFEEAEKIDQGAHPLMCHHVFIQGFPVTSTASDPWNVGKYGDLHGFTQMDDMAMIDILRSCAKDKPVISAEMLMLPGYTLDLPKEIDADDIKKLIFSAVAGNQKGFIFWQYRPEILGREAPTWGLSHLDGSMTERLKAYAECGKILQKNADLVLDSKPVPAETAIIYNPENQIFAWASTGNEKSATDALLGYHRALYERNYNVDFIHPMEFDTDILARYKVVVIPFPYVINQKIADALKKWVKEGGTLISESYTAGWNIENGHHEKTIPGYGLHEVFKVRQDVVDAPDEEGNVVIELTKDIPGLAKGAKIKGAFTKETFKTEGAEVLAGFDTGEPAVTISEYGKGKAVQIGSYIGMKFHRENIRENADLITGALEYAVKLERPKISDDKLVRVDLMSDDKGGYMLFVRNMEEEDVEVEVTLPSELNVKMTEQFNGEELEIKSDNGTSHFNIALYPKEVRVYSV